MNRSEADLSLTSDGVPPPQTLEIGCRLSQATTPKLLISNMVTPPSPEMSSLIKLQYVLCVGCGRVGRRLVVGSFRGHGGLLVANDSGRPLLGKASADTRGTALKSVARCSGVGKLGCLKPLQLSLLSF